MTLFFSKEQRRTVFNMSRKIEIFQGESFKEYNYTADPNIHIVQIFYLDFNKNIVKNKKINPHAGS